MHGDSDFRSDKTIHLGQLITGRMARNMYGRIFIGDQIHPLAQQRIMNPPDSLLITRYLARGINYRIPGIQANLLMRAIGDTRHRGAGFALRSGANHYQIFTRDKADIPFGYKIRDITQIPNLFCRCNGPVQGSSSDTNRSVIRTGSSNNTLNSGNITGKTGNSNHLLCLCNNLCQPFTRNRL